MLRFAGLILVVCAVRSLAFAVQNASPAAPQTTAAAAATPQFDVASIHPHIPEPHERSHIISENGSFTTINIDLKSIMQWAYKLPESRIIGGPPWLGTARWDIEARAENALDAQKNYDRVAAQLEKQRMVQALLADRFKLVTHTETRELPIYNLVVAKSGAKFLDAKAEGAKFDRWDDRLELRGGDDTVAVLAEQLAEALGRVVVDTTGIRGGYMIKLTWTPDDRATQSSSTTGDTPPPSIFTALEEQLGLKLESAKEPVPVLVVDHVEQPTQN
jgi:uncharacterized protein (TIGR03435 family)